MSPSPRRQGLSPRQRRLLQASARASSSSSAATSTPNKAAENDVGDATTTNSTTFSKRMEQKESQQSSSSSPSPPLPSFPSTPISKKNEDDNDSLPHNYLNDVSLSPIYDDESTPIKRGSRLLSGASDQTTPTDNITRRREVRKLGFGRYPSDEIPQQQLLGGGGGGRDKNDSFTRNNRTNISSARFTSLSNNTNNSSAAGRTTSTATAAVNNEEIYYYRITFKGVVSLLTQLYDGNDDDLNNGGKQQQQQRSSGIHVSYGEIVATSCPEISIPSFKDSNDNDDDDDESITMLKAIRVDSIVTGGYATDAIQEESISQSKSKLSTSYLSSSSSSLPASLGFNRVNEDGHYHLGYLLLSNKDGQTIAEPYTQFNTMTTATASLSSLCEHGSFSYRVNASSPVMVLSGPSLDAPPIRCALLPGTIHEVSLRISIPTSSGHHHHNHHDDNATNDDEKDTLGDDGDADVIQFLRLGRRKGWVADRRIDDGNSNKLRVSFVMIDVSNEKGLNQTTIGSQSMSMSMSFEETSSLTSFALNSTANSSFYSSLQSSSVTTPAAVKAQRKRNIRRRAGGDIARPTNIGDSFEEVESSITGGGGTTVVSGGTTVISGDGSESSQNKTETCFLCRVIAPQGLKILDAPHFQVSNLIHSPTPTKVVPPRSSTSPGFSPFSRTNAMVAENSPTLTGGRKRNTSTVRYLTRGQFFEASQRMEVTGTSSLYTKGQGLVKLADGSGWAIIPYEDELVAQFKRLHGSEPDINDLNAARGFEEVGNAVIPKQLHRLTPSKKDKSLKDVIWFRVVAPNGVKVLLPPKDKKPSNSSHTTPSKIADRDIKIERSASSHESSEVASVASSSFLDSVWSRVKVTPSKERESAAGPTTTAHADSRNNTPTKQATITVIPCGTVVPVESWDTSESPKSFVRLISQGWIPRSLGGMSYAVETGTPEIRIGSFWFRVKCSSGIDVRHGPSLNAPSISSESGTSFRFECGEYLRASEIITSFDKQQRRGRTLDDEDGPAVDCFAKLYRKSRVTNDSNQPLLNRYLSLQSYHAGGEWVQVFGNGQLLLEECSSAPSIERDRNGWRCTAVNEVQVRLGPSFHAGGTALSIHNGQEFYVVEKVTCHGEPITWMRLKDGEGWVPTMRESGEEVVHCYLQPNELNSQRMVRQILNNSSRTVY